MAFDGKAFGIEIVDAVKAHIDRRLSPILSAIDGFNSRLSDLEREFAELPTPRDGAPGPPGKDGDVAEAAKLIDEKVAALGETIAALPVVERADLDDAVTRVIDDRLPAAVAKIEIPQPQNGKDGADGRDGIGLAGGFINREGHLVLAVSNGDIRVLDRVVGRDGCDGEKGDPGARGEKGDCGNPGESVDIAYVDDVLAEHAKTAFDGLYARLGDLRDSVVVEVSRAASTEIVTQIAAHAEAISHALEASSKAFIKAEIANLPPAEKGEPGAPGIKGDKGDRGIDGRDADPAELLAAVRQEIGVAVAALPVPENGKDADPEMIRDLVAAEVERTAAPQIAELVVSEVAKIPTPKDGRNGKDVDPEVVQDNIARYVAKAVSALPPAKDGAPGKDGKDGAGVAGAIIDRRGELTLTMSDGSPRELGVVVGKNGEDGKSIEPAQIETLVGIHVDRAVAAKAVESLPRPADGHTPTPEELAPLIANEVYRAVAALPAAKDGVGMAGALLDRDGNLVVTLTDGKTCQLGPVIGRDGKDGRDGLGYDDMTFEYDGERDIKLRFARGDDVREVPIKMPAMLYRGIFREDGVYEKGDVVTYGGSCWVATKDPTGKPRDGDDTGWKLAVKAGRPGKDGERGDKGDPGRPGLDLNR